MGMGLAGHRKRLLQACKELGAGNANAAAPPTQEMACMSSAPPPVEQQPSETTRRANSTSSIYVQSTITKPDIEEVVFCLAVVIH